jgi:hypothetical protein
MMLEGERYTRTARIVECRQLSLDGKWTNWELFTTDGEQIYWETASKTPQLYESGMQIVLSFKVKHGNNTAKKYDIEQVRIKGINEYN